MTFDEDQTNNTEKMVGEKKNGSTEFVNLKRKKERKGFI